MHLSRLELTNFRCYEHLLLSLKPGITVLCGPNAQGKTNILEAVFALVLGTSFRTDTARDLIRHNADFCRIDGTAIRDGDAKRIEVIVDGRTERISKRAKIEGVSHRIGELAGQVHAVLFVPDDLNVITLSPSYRRALLDTTLSQVHRTYVAALSEYGKVLRNRNKLLEQIRDGTAQRTELRFWNDQLVKHGTTLISHRADMLTQYASRLPKMYATLTSNTAPLTIQYNSCIANPVHASDEFTSKLTFNLERDIAAGITTSGPHREDFTVCLNEYPVSHFGSRGEQRTTMLALKLCEIEYLTDHAHTSPILLLDDVFSELDAHRREQLLSIAHPEQTIVTTTDETHIQGAATVLHVKDGSIFE